LPSGILSGDHNYFATSDVDKAVEQHECVDHLLRRQTVGPPARPAVHWLMYCVPNLPNTTALINNSSWVVRRESLLLTATAERLIGRPRGQGSGSLQTVDQSLK